LRRIAKEKKQSYIKNQLIKEMPFELFETQDHDDDGAFKNTYLDYMQANQSDDNYFERKIAASKKKRQQSSLDEFIESDNVNEPIDKGLDQ
jgi:hypothetical protein